MIFWYRLVVVIFILGLTSLSAGAQCSDYENFLNYTDAQIRDSDRDRFGNLYVIGSFSSPNFRIGTTHIVLHGDYSFFLLKFDKDFNLLWARSSGTAAFGKFVTVDHDDNVVVTGQFSQVMDFDCLQLTSSGRTDVFIAKYQQDGLFSWAIHSKGDDDEWDIDVDLTPQNNLIVTGSYFPTTTMAFGDITFAESPGIDSYVVSISPDGIPLWGVHIGGPPENFPDYAEGVSVDLQGNVIVTGMFESQELYIGDYTLHLTTISENYFIAKIDANGEVLWAHDTPGPDDMGFDIATDANDNILVTGRFQPGAYSIGGIELTSNGEADVFLAKYAPDGNIINAISFGGTEWDSPQKICVDKNGNILVAGHFYSSVFQVGSSTLTKPEFQSDMFLAMFDDQLNPICVKRTSDQGENYVNSLKTDDANNILLVVEEIMGYPTDFEGKYVMNGFGSAFVMIRNAQTFEPSISEPFTFDFSLGTDIIKCSSDQTHLTAPTLCSASYLWSNGSNATSITVDDAGQYWVNVTWNGVTARDTIVVSLKENPVVTLGDDMTICEGDLVAFDVTQNDPAQYLWDNGSTSSTRTISTAGTYTVTVTGECAAVSDDIKIGLMPELMLFDLGDDRKICNGETLVLSSGVTGNVNYLWQDGSTSPHFQVKESGNYQLTISNACESVSDEINVEMFSPEKLTIPNVVTANAHRDDKNNTLILPDEFVGSRITIFNRWGELIFENPNYQNSWPEKEHSTGIYYYHITMECLDEPLKGSIHLLH
jgi:hypothetical protein